MPLFCYYPNADFMLKVGDILKTRNNKENDASSCVRSVSAYASLSLSLSLSLYLYLSCNQHSRYLRITHLGGTQSKVKSCWQPARHRGRLTRLL